MNLSFFYLSPLFSICKLTQSSPLGELIKSVIVLNIIIVRYLLNEQASKLTKSDGTNGIDHKFKLVDSDLH